MSHITRIGIDTSKAVFTLHCVDDIGRAVLQTNLRRAQMVAFFKKLPPTEIVMEACGSSHHWGRELRALGHEIRLIPPQYVKPFVKRAKNDRNDAEAICEAGGRPGMHCVPVKSVDQQAQGMVLKVRQSLVDQRTQLCNTVRGHAAELGVADDAFDEREFHIHVPAGAIPKDGPSAGVTMVTALASLLSGRPVRHTVGMTGEVTLQGRVLPIGGLKQKALAAHAAGLTDVVIPERNRGDLDEVPQEVRDAIRFHPVMTVGEVLEVALEPVRDVALS